MTADSDDVADSANKKPKGSIAPPGREQHDADDGGGKQPTGERQARENREADPPA